MISVLVSLSTPIRVGSSPPPETDWTTEALVALAGADPPGAAPNRAGDGSEELVVLMSTEFWNPSTLLSVRARDSAELARGRYTQSDDAASLPGVSSRATH